MNPQPFQCLQYYRSYANLNRDANGTLYRSCWHVKKCDSVHCTKAGIEGLWMILGVMLYYSRRKLTKSVLKEIELNVNLDLHLNSILVLTSYILLKIPITLNI